MIQIQSSKKYVKVQPVHSLGNLPDDLRFLVATYLSPKEFLTKVQILNRSWCRFALRQSLWTNLEKVWPS